MAIPPAAFPPNCIWFPPSAAACCLAPSCSPGGGLNAADPFRPVEDLQEITQRTLDHLGWTVDDLFTRPAEEMNTMLCDAAAEVTQGKEIFIFQPCIDGYTFTELPEKSIAEGNYDQNVNVICGSVKGDFWMFSRKVLPQLKEQNNQEAIRHLCQDPRRCLGTQQRPQGVQAHSLLLL